eukprot:118893-Pyramimonas_sp.AAC.1
MRAYACGARVCVGAYICMRGCQAKAGTAEVCVCRAARIRGYPGFKCCRWALRVQSRGHRP